MVSYTLSAKSATTCSSLAISGCPCALQAPPKAAVKMVRESTSTPSWSNMMTGLGTANLASHRLAPRYHPGRGEAPGEPGRTPVRQS